MFQGLPIQQYGDGSTSRDYTYIDDIVSGATAATLLSYAYPFPVHAMRSPSLSSPMPLTVRVCCAVFAGVVGAVDTPLGYEVINLGNGRPYQLKAFIQVRGALHTIRVVRLCLRLCADLCRCCSWWRRLWAGRPSSRSCRSSPGMWIEPALISPRPKPC